MTTIINGSSPSVTFSDGTTQSTAFTTGAVTQSTIATGVAGTGPAFSAYAANTQTISTGTWTKVVLNTKEFDTNNNFDSTTNYRFTPTVVGYYQVNGNASIFPATSVGFSVASIYKNGNEFKRGSVGYMNTFADGNAVSALIYFNGTTDYVELYTIHNYGSSQVLNYGQAFCYLQASMVRAA